MKWKVVQIKSLTLLLKAIASVCRVEDYELVGDVFYGLSRADDGRRFIVVCLLEQHGDSWAYLLFDESMHPYRYDCPQRFLDASDIPDSSLWRERCREFGYALAV